MNTDILIIVIRDLGYVTLGVCLMLIYDKFSSRK